MNQQQTITDDAVKAAAIRIIRWGIDEAREREAQWEEADELLVASGVDDPTDEQSEALRLRIEAAIDAIVPEVSR